MSYQKKMKLWVILLTIFSTAFVNETFVIQKNPNEESNMINPSVSDTGIQSNLSVYWNQTFGGTNGEDIGRSMVRCSSGGYLIAGWTNTSGAGDFDAILMKVFNNGTQDWNHTYGGTDEDFAYQVTECSGGGLAVFGDTKSFGPGGRELWLVRTDDSGNHLWNVTHGKVSGEDLGRSFVECDSGGFALCGVTINQSSDVWLIRTNPAGVHLWNKTYGGIEVDRCFQSHSIVECAGGGFCIAGYTISYGAGESDVYLIRTDAFGNMLWNKTYGGIYLDRPQALIECSSGGFLITANSMSYADGGAWMIRTDAFGEVLWNRTFNNTELGGAKFAVETPNRSFLIAGGSSEEGAGQGDGALILVDPQGNYVWGCMYGSATGDGVNSFVDLGNGDYTWVGYTHNWGTNDQDIWIVNFHVQLIPPGDTPDNWIYILIIAIVAVAAIGTTILVLYRIKKRRKSESN